MATTMRAVERQLDTWPKHQAWVVLLGSSCLLLDQGGIWLICLVAIHTLYRILKHQREWRHSFPRLIANMVTFFRLLILFYTGLNWSQHTLWELSLFFWLAALLDVVDGWIARRFNGASRFGSLFDEEVDALFVLFSCYVLWQTGLGPWWILGAGWIRYLVVLIKSRFPAFPEKNVHFPWARTFAGIVFILLPLCFLLPQALSRLVEIGIFSLLAYSFIRELVLSYGHPTDLRNLSR